METVRDKVSKWIYDHFLPCGSALQWGGKITVCQQYAAIKIKVLLMFLMAYTSDDGKRDFVWWKHL